MSEQYSLVGDRDHVIVEGARGDRFVRLGDEQGALGVEVVAAGDRLARLDMLAGREGPAGDAVDEDLDPGLTMRSAKPHVVGCALVAEGGRDGTVNGEVLVREGKP